MPNTNFNAPPLPLFAPDTERILANITGAEHPSQLQGTGFDIAKSHLPPSEQGIAFAALLRRKASFRMRDDAEPPVDIPEVIPPLDDAPLDVVTVVSEDYFERARRIGASAPARDMSQRENRDWAELAYKD